MGRRGTALMKDIMLVSFAQAGCSSTTQDLAWFPQRLGNGSQTSSKRTVLVRAGKGPPKQGRGYNSKKAAAEGIKKIMRERESDSSSDGWVQVRVTVPFCIKFSHSLLLYECP